jgi:nicotinamidase-related amidase
MYQDHELLGLPAMNAFRIDDRNTALLVVDMQYGAIHRDYGFHKLYTTLGLNATTSYAEDRLRHVLIPNIRLLLTAFHSIGALVMYLTIGSEREDYSDLDPRKRARIEFWKNLGLPIAYSRVGDEGHAILAEIAPETGDLVVNKTTASGFNSSSLNAILQRQGISTLVVCGVGTNYCVEMTFRDASDRGYLCILAEDATGTSSPEMHERAVDVMRFYGRVESSETVINELTASRRRRQGQDTYLPPVVE